MIGKKKVVVVLPAYNAGKTLIQTCAEIPKIVDEIVLVDDKSSDETVAMAKKIGIRWIVQHQKNLGYGGNQKTCYDMAKKLRADIVVMLHPDYQYTPKLIESMCFLIANGVYPVVLGSRILGGGARKGGMPIYKYIANRFLTLSENLLTGHKLSEYHTGFRAFAGEVLQIVDYQRNSNDFIFDNQMLLQIFAAGLEVAEITCPTKYFKEASSINFWRSTKYGLGVLWESVKYCFGRYNRKI